MDTRSEHLADPAAVDPAVALVQRLTRLESEIYRTLSLRVQVLSISAAAERVGRTDVRIRADLLLSDIDSRAGGAAVAYVTQRDLLAQAEAAGLSGLARRAHTYLSSTCDRLGMREMTMTHALAGLVDGVDLHDSDPPASAPTGEGFADADPPCWHAEALMVVVYMSMTRPGADVGLMERALAAVRRDSPPILHAVTAANFSEMAAHIGRSDVAGRMAQEATRVLDEHPDTEAVLTWESIALGRRADGDLSGARLAIERALALVPGLGLTDSNGDPWVTLAELCVDDGDAEAGLRALDAVGRPAPASQWIVVRDLRVRARLHAALAQWRLAYDAMERHLELYEQIRSIEGDRHVISAESTVTVNQERERAREFQQLALTDTLTGLPNRRAVDDGLDRLAGLDQVATAVAIVDVDHFKSVNDRFSHEMGDRVLKRLGSCLLSAAQEHLTAPHLVGRLGGEEFVLVWPATSMPETLRAAELVRATVEALDITDLHPSLSLTVSIGATYVGDPRDLHGTSRAALQRADAALYEAKNAGRNAVRAG